MPATILDGTKIAQQIRTARRIALGGDGRNNAVGAEKAESPAQFAPTDHHASVIHKTKLKRPNETLGLAPLLVDIGDLEPLLGSDRGA